MINSCTTLYRLEKTTDRQNRGIYIKKEYKLTQTSFKLCLIRAKKLIYFF